MLAPFEDVAPLRRELEHERATTLRNWLVYHQAFLLEQALGPHTLLAVRPGRLRLEPYPLVPVRRSLTMSRVRLLLADGVGLGKTIEAGLVVTELLARRLAEALARTCDAPLVLTATPHDGNDRSFASLLDLLATAAACSRRILRQAPSVLVAP